MKVFAVFAVVASIALAEPPPSNSYLPPSASGRGAGAGYSHGGPSGPAISDSAPQIVAARSLQGQGHTQGQGAHGNHGGHGLDNGFARVGGHNHGTQARFGSLSGHQEGFGGHQDGFSSRQGGFGGRQGGIGGHQGGLGDHQGYDHNAGAFGRNSLDELSGEPANYNFGYMVNDDHEGTDFGHHEERQEERAHGEYHVVLPDGRKQTVSYEADEHGFKPRVSYQDADQFSRSNGYDSNANNVRSGNHGNGFNHGGHGNHGNARSAGY